MYVKIQLDGLLISVSYVYKDMARIKRFSKLILLYSASASCIYAISNWFRSNFAQIMIAHLEQGSVVNVKVSKVHRE